MKKKINDYSIDKRMNASTRAIVKRIRTIGLMFGAINGLISAPLSLPPEGAEGRKRKASSLSGKRKGQKAEGAEGRKRKASF